MNSSLPILYSFRRCPYAIRTRMALKYSGINVEIREVALKSKPEPMLKASPKGTVPIMILPEGVVIEESREIMMWALAQNDPRQWYYGLSDKNQQQLNRLLNANDNEFKPLLDKYKYAVRFPEHPEVFYRQQAEIYLEKMEQVLTLHQYLMGEAITLADIATFPFIRQFAFVNKNWFDNSKYTKLRDWLAEFLNSELFKSVMLKTQVWQSP